MSIFAYLFGSILFVGIAYLNISSENSKIREQDDSQSPSPRRDDSSESGATSILVELQEKRGSLPSNDAKLDPVLSFRGSNTIKSSNFPRH